MKCGFVTPEIEIDHIPNGEYTIKHCSLENVKQVTATTDVVDTFLKLGLLLSAKKFAEQDGGQTLACGNNSDLRRYTDFAKISTWSKSL